MRSALAVLGIAALLAAPAAGQISGQRQMQQQPLPQTWMTIDSLAAVLSLTPAQRETVGPQLAQVNDIVKQASDRRQELRIQMGAGQPPAGGQEAFAAMREQMAAWQGQIDERHAAIRALLTPDQQAAFDALEKPQLMRPGPGRRP